MKQRAQHDTDAGKVLLSEDDEGRFIIELFPGPDNASPIELYCSKDCTRAELYLSGFLAGAFHA